MPKTHEECLEILEQLRWNGVPTCPYCQSTRSSRIKSESRYHCHDCFTSYSATVNTLFHRTRIGLNKWFLLIHYLSNKKKTVSLRKLAKKLEVSSNTIRYMAIRIKKASEGEKLLIDQINAFVSKHMMDEIS